MLWRERKGEIGLTRAVLIEEEVRECLTALQTDFRGMCHLFPIGKSLLGRPLWCLKIGEGAPYLYVGTHHAMEDVTGRILLRFVRELLEGKWGKKQGVSYYVLPLLNPDGTRLRLDSGPTSILRERVVRMNGGSTDFSHWQANARGVDLNHNYPYGFDAYKEIEREGEIGEGAPTKYSGPHPLSEPETNALTHLIRVVNPRLTIALHTQGREIYIGECASQKTYLATEILSRRIGYRLTRPTGTAAYGGLTDYLASEGIPAMTVEVGKGVNPLRHSQLDPLYLEVSSLLFYAPLFFP